ncbi:MAG: acetoacetate--CoA ligase [Candidatus Kapaibacteriales bacterium]
MTNEIMWQPSQEQIEGSNLTSYMSWVSAQTGLSFPDYDSFYDFSVSENELFWKLCLSYSGIIFEGDDSKVRTEVEGSRIPRGKWFPDVKLSFAENLLRGEDTDEAIVAVCEGRDEMHFTLKELKDEVTKVAGYLESVGVSKGDRVAGFVLNVPEALIGMLAANSLGAIWSSCSPDFGYEGALDRFGQIEPKILIAVSGYYYGGREFDTLERVAGITKAISSIKKTIVIDITGKAKAKTGDNELWGESNICQIWSELPETNRELSFLLSEFDHPVYIMYSSGTTGKPKCIVHGAGGTLLQHWKEHHLHGDLRQSETISYFTTCGWMMWNWLVSAIMLRARLFLFDGSPGHPSLNKLWQEAEKHNISTFGTSPKFLSACQKAGISPKESIGTNSIKTVLSTGSPLTDVNFEYFYSEVAPEARLSSISGGTDIISCFMLGNPILPVRKGEIQCRGLGMAVAAYDQNGSPVTGEKGELVCTKPFPSMPVFFWQDDNDERYFNSYFDRFEGVWTHGDFVEVTESGGMIVYGRSDATLNPGGIRIGTAEIYRIAEANKAVKDSICVGLPTDDGDVEVVLFVVMQQGFALDEELVKTLRSEIRKGATPRHVPARILEVVAIPVTISGKKVEIAVANRLRGIANNNLSALANPESLDDFDKYSIKQS